MLRTYRYVGPAGVLAAVGALVPGNAVLALGDIPRTDEPLTFVIDLGGTLRVAPRRSEHVACAAGRPVLSAGEITFELGSDGPEVTCVTNQSTGYCPEPSSWPAVAAALERIGVPHPGRFTDEFTFRRCPRCGERNLVRDGDFTCAICEADLPASWNFAPPVRIETAAPDLPAAAEILREYLGEMISRYHGRPADSAEIDKHLGAGHGSDDLVEPTGILLLALGEDGDGRPVGCVGLRRLDEQTRELTRMFVRPDARGTGVAAALLAAAEQRAWADGAAVIRLNTRSDLVEARALYAKHAYREIPRYSADPMAEHWFEKRV